jgi:type IV pilus assembly protein PilN
VWLGHEEVFAVILINLLPHREAARKRRREAFFVALGAAALIGGVIAGVVFGWYQAQISMQQFKNQFLQGEIKKLDSQIKDIANLQAEIAALRARQQAVEDLQADRNLPVHLLNELVKQLPDGVYINSLKQDNQVVSIQGVAQSNERVSELLRNLANTSAWLSRPELIEIVAGTVSLGGKEQRRVSNFTMKIRMNRANEVTGVVQAASGASAPAKK